MAVAFGVLVAVGTTVVHSGDHTSHVREAMHVPARGSLGSESSSRLARSQAHMSRTPLPMVLASALACLVNYGAAAPAADKITHIPGTSRRTTIAVYYVVQPAAIAHNDLARIYERVRWTGLDFRTAALEDGEWRMREGALEDVAPAP